MFFILSHTIQCIMSSYSHTHARIPSMHFLIGCGTL